MLKTNLSQVACLRSDRHGSAIIVVVTTRVFTAVLRKEDELWVAQCPEAGTASQGNSVEEAVANLKEATELYLEEFPLEGGSPPFLTTFEATCA